MKTAKIKNIETGLFWYGFGKGEGLKGSLFAETDFPDVEENKATHYDLNNDNEAAYVKDNFKKDEHEIILI